VNFAKLFSFSEESALQKGWVIVVGVIPAIWETVKCHDPAYTLTLWFQ
jgi:hypothetical protein